MHLDNTFYGHRRILARWCGLPEAPIWGHVQHGWGATTGYSQFPPRLVPWLPKLVWSAHNAAEAERQGLRRVRQIGAPWAYLLAREGVPARPGDGSTLFFPAHGWERNRIDADHDALIEALRTRETGPITVCLYWHDYQDPDRRGRFERAGLRVVCNGHRSNQDFLTTMLAEIGRHDRVASNRVSTPIWYGGLAGREIEVYGPTFHFHDPREGAVWREVERARWPALLEGGLAAEDAPAVAADELGADALLEPGELAAVLGWDPPTPRARALVRRAALADHHLRRIVVNAGKLARLPGWR